MDTPAPFTVKSGTKGSNEIDIFIDLWTRLSDVKTSERTLVVIHGYGEHSGRYRHLKDSFLDYFDAVFAIDLRGHGKSGGTRGHSENMGEIHQDIETCFRAIKERAPNARFDLFCHSLGGLIGISLLQKWSQDLKAGNRPPVAFHKVAFSAPLLEVALPVPALLKSIASLLNHTLSKLQLWSEINPMHLSHDPKMTEAYTKDRLIHSKITPRMYFSLEEAMALARKNTQALPYPALFMVAGDDKIVSSKAIKEYFSNLKQDTKKIVEFPGMYHELVNELEREKVIDVLMKWYKE